MCSDLIKIKDKYGERMMHLCRKLFPTILEEEGRLFELLSSYFAYSKYLYDDIVNNLLIDNFRTYIYSLYETECEELVEIDKTPSELLDDAGYVLYECKNEEDIQAFRKYYNSGECLCSFRGYRLRTCYVFFAVKKNVDEIRREDFINPYRQDIYGTSVISIQFAKGDVNTLSIKNRYNHKVINPDATYSNNLENIIPGLTRSFEKYYNLNISQNNFRGFEIPGYVRTRDVNTEDVKIPGKDFRYNYQINNIYYCDDNIIIDNFMVVDKYQEKEKYIVMDYYIIDLVNKEIGLYDKTINNGIEDSIRDSFIYSFDNIKKIEIVRCKDTKNRKLKIIYNDDKYVFIEIDKHNRMISYSNNYLSLIPDDFLRLNLYLEKIDIPNVLNIGDNVLYENKYLMEINANRIIEIGDKFLYNNNSINYLSFPMVIRVGNDFLYNNRILDDIRMFNLAQVGDSYLYENRSLREINFPNLLYVGDGFISCNRIIEDAYLGNLVNVGNCFLSGNKGLIRLDLSELKQVGDNFLRCNEILVQFLAENLEIVGSNFMYSNRNLLVVCLSRLRYIENNFLYKNNSIKILDLSELCKVGPCFMKENNSLLILLASKLKVVGINFLPNNNVLEYTELNSLENYGRGFLDNNINVKKRVLSLVN